MADRKKAKRREGDFIAIPLGSGTYGYGRILREPLIGFYDLRSDTPLAVERLAAVPFVFVLFVMNYAVTEGIWPVIGHAPLANELLDEPLFFKKDPLSGALTLYRDSTGEEAPATQDDCKGLERGAVWEPEHVVDRLIDHFAGRSNKWVQSLRP